MKTFISDISKQAFPLREKVQANTLRDSILSLIKIDHPNFTEQSVLSIQELNVYRERFIAQCLQKEVGELNKLEQSVMQSLQDKTVLTDQLETAPYNITLGQQLADKVASFGGSWTFISSFALFLMLWIIVNVVVFSNKGFDPYPFILLNLILSCIAAIQAPIIMMSQNRQEEKDRERAKKDYMINLKSELEIRILHEKIDHLIVHQQQQLLEIQQVQVELLNDIYMQLDNRKSPTITDK